MLPVAMRCRRVGDRCNLSGRLFQGRSAGAKTETTNNFLLTYVEQCAVHHFFAPRLCWTPRTFFPAKFPTRFPYKLINCTLIPKRLWQLPWNFAAFACCCPAWTTSPSRLIERCTIPVPVSDHNIWLYCCIYGFDTDSVRGLQRDCSKRGQNNCRTASSESRRHTMSSLQS